MKCKTFLIHTGHWNVFPEKWMINYVDRHTCLCKSGHLAIKLLAGCILCKTINTIDESSLDLDWWPSQVQIRFVTTTHHIIISCIPHSTVSSDVQQPGHGCGVAAGASLLILRGLLLLRSRTWLYSTVLCWSFFNIWYCPCAVVSYKVNYLPVGVRISC